MLDLIDRIHIAILHNFKIPFPLVVVPNPVVVTPLVVVLPNPVVVTPLVVVPNSVVVTPLVVVLNGRQSPASKVMTDTAE